MVEIEITMQKVEYQKHMETSWRRDSMIAVKIGRANALELTFIIATIKFHSIFNLYL